MMPALNASQSLTAMISVAVVLGLRHGFDADHLAAIGGMTRFNSVKRPSLAKRTGLWFSVGHGAVVLTVAISVARLSSLWVPPRWLEPLGAWCSIAILLLFGSANLLSIYQAPSGGKASLLTWRSFLFTRLFRVRGACSIMGIGGLFAISFDTISQATLMAVSGAAYQGLTAVVSLAIAFAVGMIIMDGINGAWTARLLERADHMAKHASQIMTAGVAFVSIGTAILGIGTRFSAQFAIWVEVHEGQFGWVIVTVISLSFLIGFAYRSKKGCG